MIECTLCYDRDCLNILEKMHFMTLLLERLTYRGIVSILRIAGTICILLVVVLG